MWLFLAFLMVPLIEIALFIQVGGLIGLWPTLAVVVLTAVIGTWLVKAQGRLAMDNLRRSFSDLDDPSEPLAHGAMILVSGALLLTPGFFTDAVGFALLAPPVRTAVFAWLRRRVHVTRFQMGPDPRGPVYPDPRAGSGQGDVIDGEFTEVPKEKAPNHPGSGWTRH
ncbi:MULTISPECIES: FxsA family protein [Mameliella]|uniref:FxsA n=1 Tax=Mameliella alba TaxID=561184 RepID=A0A0B3S710_9RHOB|nr:MULTISPECIES: FxsA family protein [Mameliella]MBV6634665.1 FxsA family protein [Mameliella sp.]MCR9273141.1 FxsA family protein [Paracoccaceae bacterium]KHQ52446.1 FxsA [Mameliella alba]MBY6120592.1 FxsA family protein [Mameliella alba]OWV42907.1 exlusion protein FxsA [Mameliella alba]